MTAFNRENINTYRGWVEYYIPGGDRKFVARFKYAKDGMGSFITFLIKNFTVEEYFSRLDAGEGPLTILQSKGYLQPHIKKMLKAGGYEVSAAGYKKLISDQATNVIEKMFKKD